MWRTQGTPAIHPSLALPLGGHSVGSTWARAGAREVSLHTLCAKRALIGMLQTPDGSYTQCILKDTGVEFLRANLWSYCSNTQCLQCGVWRRVLSTWSTTLSVAFSHFPNPTNTHEMCCHESHLTPQREVQSLQGVTTPTFKTQQSWTGWWEKKGLVFRRTIVLCYFLAGGRKRQHYTFHLRVFTGG